MFLSYQGDFPLERKRLLVTLCTELLHTKPKFTAASRRERSRFSCDQARCSQKLGEIKHKNRTPQTTISWLFQKNVVPLPLQLSL